MDVENFRQMFAVEYVILPQPCYWAELQRGQKFALNRYGFSEKEQRFEIYTKRTWVKAFLETNPQKLDFPIWKLINPLDRLIYPIIESYYFNE